MADPMLAKAARSPDGSLSVGMNGAAVSHCCRADKLHVQALIKDHGARAERICSHLPDWWQTGAKPSS